MKKRLVFVLMIFANLLVAQTATTPSGNGNSETPYLIANLNNLYWVTQNRSEWGKVFKQTASIDASGTSSWDSNKGFLPIGDGTTAFSGSYDGQSYIITGLFINRSITGLSQSYFVGLFGITGGATITNIKLTSVNISGNTDYGSASVGALIGYASNTVTSYCSSTGSVTSPQEWAGVGGLIGYQENLSSIINCFSSCNVSGTGNLPAVGGLLGCQNGGSTVSASYSTGTVSTLADHSAPVGGLVGLSKGTISGSSYCSVSNCYSTSIIVGGYIVGGLVGQTESNTTVSNSYSTGSSTSNGGSNVGGLIGRNDGSNCTSNCFWDTETSHISSRTGETGGTGKTTTEMKTTSTFLNAGWSGTVWNIGDGINNSYPYLKWQNSGGTPLPVELISFTANASGSSVSLKWQTATEVNNYGFEILRFAQNDKWEKIAFVEGHGNSNSPKSYSFTDAASPAGKISYRLRQIDFDGKFEYSNVVDVTVSAPTSFFVKQNFPNPFNPITTIKYELPTNSFVTLKVFDVLGKEVASLFNGNETAGTHQINFDGRNLPSGMYIYKVQAGNFVQTKKMLLLK